ncbi:unnamed protein product, partial [Rotaria sp. Silwood1]
MFTSSSDHTIIIPDIPVQSNENLIAVKMIDNSITSIQLISPQSARMKRRHYFILILIFLFSILSLCMIYILFPKIDIKDKDALKIPKTIDDAKILGNILYKYSKHHRYIIMIAFFLTYILRGSIFLCILAGVLYSFRLELFFLFF